MDPLIKRIRLFRWLYLGTIPVALFGLIYVEFIVRPNTFINFPADTIFCYYIIRTPLCLLIYHLFHRLWKDLRNTPKETLQELTLGKLNIAQFESMIRTRTYWRYALLGGILLLIVFYHRSIETRFSLSGILVFLGSCFERYYLEGLKEFNMSGEYLLQPSKANGSHNNPLSSGDDASQRMSRTMSQFHNPSRHDPYDARSSFYKPISTRSDGF